MIVDLNVTKQDSTLVQNLEKETLGLQGSEMSINQLRAQFQIYTDILPDEEVFQEGHNYILKLNPYLRLFFILFKI